MGEVKTDKFFGLPIFVDESLSEDQFALITNTCIIACDMGNKPAKSVLVKWVERPTGEWVITEIEIQDALKDKRRKARGGSSIQSRGFDKPEGYKHPNYRKRKIGQ